MIFGKVFVESTEQLRKYRLSDNRKALKIPATDFLATGISERMMNVN